jgi:hypothetical protein
MFNTSHTFSGRTFRIMRWMLRFIILGIIGVLGIILYLNLFGVPGPVLRSVIKRINDAGVRIDIEDLHLSFYGWRASNVRYFSHHPDDLNPLLSADLVFIRPGAIEGINDAPLRGYRLRAEGIRFCPSVEWCLGLPEDSALNRLEQVELTLARAPGRLVFHDGLIKGDFVEVHIDGVVLEDVEGIKSADKPLWSGERPVLTLDPELYLRLENEMQAIALTANAVVNIEFRFDAMKPEASRFMLSAHTGNFTYRDVAFSRAEVMMSYALKRFELNHATLQRSNRMLGVKGEYDLRTGEMRAWASNDIPSKRLFLLLPQRLLAGLAQQGIRSESFPQFDIEFGPAVPDKLLDNLKGKFAVQNAAVEDLELTSVEGYLSRSGKRLEIVDIEAHAVSQEHRAEEVGSCMQGGHASGEFFLDTARHEFGFTAEGRVDPNLFLNALERVEPAVNVISRFRFDETAPKLRVEVGACYTDWEQLYVDVRGEGEDVRLHDVPLSSLSASAYYSKGVLSLDRIVARQESDYLKGSAAIDFRNGRADFAGTGSINPAALEDVIYPDYGIFGDAIKVSGDIHLSGQGTLDWRYMKETAFAVSFDAQKVDLPMASLDGFIGTVSGDGTVITVQDTSFGVYGGVGSGLFSVVLDPSTSGVPYRVDAQISNVDFNQCLKYLDPEAAHEASGDLSGELNAAADFTRGFYESANGSGWVDIRNGQLADLPFFHGFSTLVRRVIPSFRVFSINRLNGNFNLRDGVIYSDNAYFDGNLLSAKARGRYSTRKGFDAYLQVQTFSEGNLSRVLRYITDPLLKLFEMKLEGTLKEPEWKLNTFIGPASDGIEEDSGE